MLSFVRALVARYHRMRRSGRARWLRARYDELLSEVSRPLDERVRFHLEHIGEYWERCDGFLDHARQLSRVDEAFLVADWVLCPLVGSGAADADVRAYAARHGAAGLLGAWTTYAAALAELGHARPTPEAAVVAATAAFAKVRAAYESAIPAASTSRPAV